MSTRDPRSAQIPPLTVRDKTLYRADEPVVLRGIGGTTTEYLFKGGVLSGAFLNFFWDNSGTTRLPSCDGSQNSPVSVSYNSSNGIDDQLQLLLDSGPPGVLPIFRIPLNLDYYLHDPADALGDYSNQGCAAIYQASVDLLVDHFTTRGIAVILDLHWNAAGSGYEQCGGNCSPSSGCGGYMAIREAVDFWSLVALKYQSNPLVLFELYNEPMCSDSVLSQEVWLDGGTLDGQSIEYAGMSELYQAIRGQSVENVVIVGGNNWAYNPSYCRAFADATEPSNTLYSLHPYQGAGQGPDKSVEGFKAASSELLEVGPVIVTEFGQYCLTTDYDEQILAICNERDISWLGWAWRPPGGGDCGQPDVNRGSQLYDSSLYEGKGGDWKTLWPTLSIAPRARDASDRGELDDG
ncbi:MAG: cellulase family glycosylhydrolase [Acidobacteriota bacterium]